MGSTANTVKIALLGPLQVTVAGEERPITGPVRRQLLAVFALHPGEPLSVERLCDLVWDGAPPPTAASALRVHISQLRQMLGAPELIEKSGTGYRLTIAPSDVDTFHFEQHSRAGREALADGDLTTAERSLHAAKELWRGAPLADVRMGSEVGLERLYSVRSELSVDLAELQMRRQGVNADISDLVALSVERPYDERVWRLLITAQYWIGRQADALESYRRAVDILQEELGIEPMPMLHRLQEQILRQDPALDPPAGAEVKLPSFATSFVGRDDDVAEVASLVGGHRLVTLTGLGGVGKTRLSVAAATELADSFSHGVRFISLAGVEDPALVSSVIASALDTHATTGEDLATAIGSQQLLIVLDNCEHVLAAAAEVVAALLAGAAGVRVLATSLVPLGLVGECVSVTAQLDAGGVSGRFPDAVQLFRERAAQAGPRTPLPSADDPLLHEIAELLGGIPLALELAAAQCNVLTVTDVAERIRRAAGESASERDRPARHDSMRRALAGTLKHLSDPARLLLSRLTVFRGPVGIDAIEAVCSCEELAVERIPVALADLVQASLLVADVGGMRGRYWLPLPVRHAGEQLLTDAGGDRDALRSRHLDVMAIQSQTDGSALWGPDASAATARLIDLMADLRAALTWAIRTDPERGLEMSAALSSFWLRQRMHAEGRRWIRELVEAGVDVAPAVRAAALHSGGGLAWDDGDREEAERLLHEAWRIRTSIGDKAGLGLTLNNLAGLASDRGDHTAAALMWKEAHELFVASDHKPGAAASLMNQGIVAHKQARWEDAVRLLEEARRAYQDLGVPAMEAMTLERLATVHAEHGQHRRAMTLTRSAQEIYEQEGTAEQRARLHWLRALRHRDLDEDEPAAEYLRHAAQSVIAEELFDAWWTPSLIETAAALAADTQPTYAAGLLGVARRHRERSGHAADPVTVSGLTEIMNDLGEALGRERLTEEMAVRGSGSAAVAIAGIAGVRRESVDALIGSASPPRSPGTPS